MDNRELEDRTFQLAQRVRGFVQSLPRTMANRNDFKELIVASGLAGAHCVAANEATSKKDFVLRMKLTRREIRKSRYWLRLLYTGANNLVEQQREELIEECTGLIEMLGNVADFDLRYLKF